MTQTNIATLVKAEYGDLVGARVATVRQLTTTELADLGWEDYDHDFAVVLFLDNGKALIPSRDPEGNGPGHLFVEGWKPVAE